MPLRFDNRVVIVTGAGAGLGRAYALMFASRGAKVVVNDLGTSFTGEGKNSKAADLVVDEIKKNGGEAIPNYDSVENGAAIVKTAVDKWGRVDIVINNAGILRDVSFMKMKDSEWDIIYKVHLFGAYSVTRAAWNQMRDQGFGRIIMTTSAAGLYGNFGQANYSAMKLGLVGFAATLAKEGEKRNVLVNTIAPLAGTRLTETVMPPDLVAALKPEYIAPLVLYLCHEESKVNGQIFEVGAGWIANVRWQRSKGHFFDLSGGSFTPEAVGAQLGKVTDFADATYPTSPNDSFGPITANLEKVKAKAAAGGVASAKAKGNDAVDVETALKAQFPPAVYTYTVRDAALYALSVGVAKAGPADEKQLAFVYENAADFKVLPTMGVIFPFAAMMRITNTPGLKFNPMMLLHGEQALELKRPIPQSGTLTSSARIVGIYDKGKGALVVLETVTRDEKGQEICVNQFSSFIRGIGGFGGDRGPAQEANDPPARAPDAVSVDKTSDSQALFYRWTSGDLNPLHADPSMAAMGGFDKPILHGLCTFGHAGKAVLQHFCGWDPANFKSIKARFNRHVFPGETLVTEMWKVAPNKVIFRVKVEERNEYAIVGGVVEIAGAGPAPAAGAPAASAASAFKSAPLFAELDKKVAAGGADLVKKVAGVYQFDINAGGKTRSWSIDLKTGPVGKVIDGPAPKPDVTLSLGDDDCVALFGGKLNSQQAFMQGKLKIKGDMKFAMKLGTVISSQGAAKL